MPLELRAGEGPASMPRLLAALRTSLALSVRTAHPLFLNQLYARPEPAGVAGAACRPALTLQPMHSAGAGLAALKAAVHPPRASTFTMEGERSAAHAGASCAARMRLPAGVLASKSAAASTQAHAATTCPGGRATA